jgi:hypothetical protein
MLRLARDEYLSKIDFLDAENSCLRRRLRELSSDEAMSRE